MEVFIAAVVIYALGWVYLRRRDRRRRGGNGRSLTTTSNGPNTGHWADYRNRQDHP